MGGNAADRTITVTVNGERRDVERGSTLGTLLRDLSIESSRLAIERNREILDPTRFDATVLEAEDSIEIVQFVGGG